MKGLRTQENNKFNKFFNLVQSEANKENAVFFCDCGQGDIFEDESIECEDMCGWLIPEAMASDFEQLFKDNAEGQHDYDDFYILVDYNMNNGEVDILFK